MQKISLALNIILLLAVGYLFGQHFKEKTDDRTKGSVEVTSEPESVASSRRMAFVNVDSLDTKYQYIIDFYEDLEKAKKRGQTRLENEYRDAESKSAQLQKDAVYMTTEQRKSAEAQLQQLALDLQKSEQSLTSDIQKMQINANKAYQEKLVSYLDEYSEGKEYDCILGVSSIGSVLWSKDALDITNEVLDKLNSDYQASLKVEEEK